MDDAGVDRWKDSPGFIGIKAHPFRHRYPPRELAPVAERAHQLGRPLLIHLGFGEHGDIGELIDKFPG